MYCPSCGAENEDAAKFCQGCGGNLEAAGESAAPPEEPAPPSEEAPPPTAPPPPSAPPPSSELDIGGWVSKAFNEVSSDLGAYILLGLVVSILTFPPFFLWVIFMGPVTAGSLWVIRRKLRGQGAIDITAALSEGFGVFLPSFLAVLFVGIILTVVHAALIKIPAVGWLLSLLVSLALSFLWPFWAIAFHYIAEEKKDFAPALQRAWEVVSANFAAYWVLGILSGILLGVGYMLCYVGSFFFIPVVLVMMALMLESLFPPK